MRSGGTKHLGLPSRSLVIGIRHSTTFDDMLEDLDETTAKATDAAVGDLRPLEKAAIHCEYLNAKWIYEHANIHVVLVVARNAVRMGLMKREIV